MEKELMLVSRGGFALCQSVKRVIRLDNKIQTRPTGIAGLFWGSVKKIVPKNGNEPFNVAIIEGKEIAINQIDACYLGSRVFTVVLEGKQYEFGIVTAGKEAAEFIYDAWRQFAKSAIENYKFTGMEPVRKSSDSDSQYAIEAMIPVFEVWKKVDLRDNENWLMFRHQLGEILLDIETKYSEKPNSRKVTKVTLIEDLADRDTERLHVFRVEALAEFNVLKKFKKFNTQSDVLDYVYEEKTSVQERSQEREFVGTVKGSGRNEVAVIDEQEFKFLDQVANNIRMRNINKYYDTDRGFSTYMEKRQEWERRKRESDYEGDDSDSLIRWIVGG
jgi:hypothetical protein